MCECCATAAVNVQADSAQSRDGSAAHCHTIDGASAVTSVSMLLIAVLVERCEACYSLNIIM
jgi:hypothetical protein